MEGATGGLRGTVFMVVVALTACDYTNPGTPTPTRVPQEVLAVRSAKSDHETFAQAQTLREHTGRSLGA